MHCRVLFIHQHVYFLFSGPKKGMGAIKNTIFKWLRAAIVEVYQACSWTPPTDKFPFSPEVCWRYLEMDGSYSTYIFGGIGNAI